MTSPPASENDAGSPQVQGPGQLPAQHVVRRTRFGGVWVASALFALMLLLLLIFILEKASGQTLPSSALTATCRHRGLDARRAATTQDVTAMPGASGEQPPPGRP